MDLSVDPQPDRPIAQEDPEGGSDETIAYHARVEDLAVDEHPSVLGYETYPDLCGWDDHKV